MGLDINLNWYNNFSEAKKLEAKYEIKSKLIWEGNDEDGKYELLSKEQKDAYKEKEGEAAKSLGLDERGSFSNSEEYKRIEKTHEKYPDHYFKIGYFRSSYNEGGIERILKNLGLNTMAWAFQREDEEEYEFIPDWELALKRITEIKGKLEIMDPIRCYSVGENIFGEPPKIKSESDAIKAFLEEKDRMLEGLQKSSHEPYNYSNSVGEFRMAQPESILAMIPGQKKILGVTSCVYMIVESDNQWYIEALEIVQDTIKFVLSQKDKEKYSLSWSG